MSPKLITFTAIVLLESSCSNLVDKNDQQVPSSHWANPAFGGTISQIDRLQKSSGSISEWQKAAEVEKDIGSNSQMSDVLSDEGIVFPITIDEALDLYKRSDKAYLFRFRGLYFAIVFFDDSGHSFHVVRHL